MKRFLALLAAVLAALMLSLPSFASPKTDLYKALREACPERYYTTYLAMFENVLAQIPVSREQADKCIRLAKETRKIVSVDRGPDIGAYPKEEQEVVLLNIKETFETLGLTVRIRAVSGSTVWELVRDGKVVGEISRHAIRDTGAPEKEYGILIASGAGCASMLALFTVLAVRAGRRKNHEEI